MYYNESFILVSFSRSFLSFSGFSDVVIVIARGVFFFSFVRMGQGRKFRACNGSRAGARKRNYFS